MRILILQKLGNQWHEALQVYWLDADLLAKAVLAQESNDFHKVGNQVRHLHFTLKDVSYLRNQQSRQTRAQSNVLIHVFTFVSFYDFPKHFESWLNLVFLLVYLEIVWSHLEYLNDSVKKLMILPQDWRTLGSWCLLFVFLPYFIKDSWWVLKFFS